MTSRTFSANPRTSCVLATKHKINREGLFGPTSSCEGGSLRARLNFREDLFSEFHHLLGCPKNGRFWDTANSVPLMCALMSFGTALRKIYLLRKALTVPASRRTVGATRFHSLGTSPCGLPSSSGRLLLVRKATKIVRVEGTPPPRKSAEAVTLSLAVKRRVIGPLWLRLPCVNQTGGVRVCRQRMIPCRR